jgi:hypothetical protein
MKLKSLAIALLLIASPVFAADIDGEWKGSVDSPNGAVEVKFTFKAGEKDALTGTASSPDGGTLPIAEGKVAGGKISFSLTLDFGAGPTVLQYTGELVQDKLMLKTSVFDMPIEIALTKT